MGLAAVSGNARFWMLMVASLIQGAMFGLIGPARVSTSAELVGREQLGNAISLTSMSMSLTRLFAPAAAGVLAGVATIGIGGAYLVAAVFSVVSTLLTARLPRLEPSNPSRQNPLDEIRDGLRYVRGKPELGRLILTTTIAIMVGGTEDLFARARPIFETVSPNVFHAGDIGAGHAMKVINNMISSCIRLATFEGLALATKAGIEPMRFAEILSKGAARGFVADTTLPKYVIPGRQDQGFGLALMYKDLSLATQLGQDMKAPLITGNYAREVFRGALNQLGEDVDITQIVRLFERAAGVDVCAAQEAADEAG